jgi:hypothetical protein
MQLDAFPNHFNPPLLSRKKLGTDLQPFLRLLGGTVLKGDRRMDDFPIQPYKGNRPNYFVFPVATFARFMKYEYDSTDITVHDGMYFRNELTVEGPRAGKWVVRNISTRFKALDQYLDSIAPKDILEKFHHLYPNCTMEQVVSFLKSSRHFGLPASKEYMMRSDVVMGISTIRRLVFGKTDEMPVGGRHLSDWEWDEITELCSFVDILADVREVTSADISADLHEKDIEIDIEDEDEDEDEDEEEEEKEEQVVPKRKRKHKHKHKHQRAGVPKRRSIGGKSPRIPAS